MFIEESLSVLMYYNCSEYIFFNGTVTQTIKENVSIIYILK